MAAESVGLDKKSRRRKDKKTGSEKPATCLEPQDERRQSFVENQAASLAFRGLHGAKTDFNMFSGAGEKAKKDRDAHALPRKWKVAQAADGQRQQELEKRNCTKYHYLKFVEKQKVERKLLKVRKRLEATSAAGDKEATKILRRQLKAHLADYEYVSHYPKHLPYTSLFPKEDTPQSQKRREQLRRMIRDTLATEGDGLEGVVAEGDEADCGNDNVDGEEKNLEIHPSLVKRPKSEDAAAARRRKKKEKARQKRDLKRKLAKQDAAGKTSAEERQPKKLKGAAGRKSERAAAEPSSLKSKKLKKRNKSSENTGDIHPSWQASKLAKVSGSLVEGVGKRMSFESDSE